MIVVTGGTGHVGNVLVRQLLSIGEEVKVVIPPFENETSLKGLDVEKVEGDILNINSLYKAFKDAQVVYHLAAVISTMPGKNELMRSVNVDGTINVIKACLDCGISRMVYTSSIHALADVPKGEIIDESVPFDPYTRRRGEYDRTKAQASLEVLKAVEEQGLDAVIVCPTGVVGPWDFKPSQMGQFFLSFAKKKLKAYVGGAFNFVDVRDVARGLILACQKGLCGERYIISGELITIEEMMSVLQDITGVEPPRFKMPAWAAKIIAFFAVAYSQLVNKEPLFTKYSIDTIVNPPLVSHEKATRELGYHHYPIRNSIRDTIKWFQKMDML